MVLFAKARHWSLGGWDGKPAEASDYRSQGKMVQGGRTVEGRSSENTFYMAWDGKDHVNPSDAWSFGQGDPPSRSAVAFGGGKPVILNGLPYGAYNQYRPGSPPGLPASGDPGEGNRQYLTQRSNNGVKELEELERSYGMVVTGVSSVDNRLIIVVNQHGSKPGMKLSEMRDYLLNEHVSNALAWDGSESATLVKDSTIMVAPGDRKNNALSSGIGLRVK